MSKAKTLLLSSALTISGLFAAQAQTSANDDKLIAMNDPAKTEVVADNKKDVLNPPVREGHFGQAQTLSGQNNLLVIYISGGKGSKEEPEQYTAKEYAEILQKSFANPKYTDNPADIVVFYEESGRDGVSTASVLINGDEWKTKEGDRVFTPRLIGKHIDVFADAYAKTKAVSKD